MTSFVKNPVDFAADCARENGQCVVARENFVFLKDGNEPAAIKELQMKCGRVVFVPDKARKGSTLLYHTSCQRMTDVVTRIFKDALGAPASLPLGATEMTVGELYRRPVAISYEGCRSKVENFAF
jgi:hypothetical protein